MQQALTDAPGDQQLVLGETAGLLKSTRYVTSVPDFIAGLPEGPRLRLHASGPSTPTSAATTRSSPRSSALNAHGCPKPPTIWITETGVGNAPKDLSAGGSIADAAEGCRALHERLVQWYDDPRVTVAFQYTVREDDKFPVGLVSTDLATDRPALEGMDRVGRQPQRRPTRRRRPPAEPKDHVRGLAP